jgi:hypothetical protein
VRGYAPWFQGVGEARACGRVQQAACVQHQHSGKQLARCSAFCLPALGWGRFTIVPDLLIQDSIENYIAYVCRVVAMHAHPVTTYNPPQFGTPSPTQLTSFGQDVGGDAIACPGAC